MSPRLARVAVLTTMLSLLPLAMPATGHAAAAPACPAPLALATTVLPPGGTPFLLCSGKIPSFDGTPLDVDVSIPTTATGPLPLVVMMHGWGNNKADWESTTLEGGSPNRWHWNNAWFASQGYAVLNYSARGFADSCGKDAAKLYVYALDPACLGKASWTHLGDRRWETHDTQFLAGTLVDDGVATPRVVVTGGSYGGAQSWMLALSGDQVVDPGSAGTPVLHPWTSPGGVPMHIAAAVPEYPWTDLTAALVPNGRASDGFHGAPPRGSSAQPIGIAKQTYVSGLFALGVASGQYAPPLLDPTSDLTSWFAAVNAGEPYELNPLAQEAVRETGSPYRSAIAVPVPDAAHRVPVFFAQGNTDPLFPAYQGAEEMNRLLAVDPAYPVWSFYGDLGHSYAQNPASVWHEFNDMANVWLATVLAGGSPSQPRVTMATTQCLPGQTLVNEAADTYSHVATNVVHFRSTSTQQTVNVPLPLPEGIQTDPIANSGCRTMATTTDPGVAAYTFSPAAAMTIAGAPVIRATVTVNGINAELAARLWDVDPATGRQTLVSRTVYRLVVAIPGSVQKLAFELSANAWQVAAGHQLKLELTQDDSPVWRPDNLPSSLSISGVRVDVPAIG